MRDKRRQEWSAQLPSPGGSKIAISGILPDSTLARSALQLVPRPHRKDDALAAKTSNEAQLMLCIKSIGGKAVNYDKLSAAGLDKWLDQKQQVLVKRLFTHLTTPNEAEIGAFIDSISIERTGSDWRWTGRIVIGGELERLLEARDDVERLDVIVRDLRGDIEALDALEVDDDDELADVERQLETLRGELEDAVAQLEGAERELGDAEQAGFDVAGVMPNSKISRQSVEQIPKKLREYPLAVTKEAQENLIRNTLRSVDGQNVSYADLKGDDLDDWLSAKEQHLVIVALSQTAVPDEEETADFLESIEIG